MPYWLNALEVAREERSAALRKHTASIPGAEVQAMVEPHNAEREFQAPSTDGLEVIEVTVLDIIAPCVKC